MPRPGPRPTCAGPSCSRPAVAEGLCASHYKQRQRGKPLAPLRDVNAAPLVRVSARVRQETADALGPEPGTRLREIVEEWADKRR